MSHTSRIVRVDQRVSATRAVQVPLLIRLRSSCNHVTELGESQRLGE